MAWVISIVCVPEVVDQLALVVPLLAISRNSERGYPEPLVVAPPQWALNTTPLRVPLTRK
jgi:hypothetical protein